MSESRVPVMVTTDKRGVFFGYLPEFPATMVSEIELTDARMCTMWSTEMHGVFGLAAIGPGEGCRVGPKVPRKRLNGLTSVTLCAPEAAARWEAEPWS